MGASAGFSDCTDNATTAYISPMPDPLELELCAGEGPPAWVDPMLEELVASLAMIAGAPTVECSPPLPVASHGMDASLGDSHSPVMFPNASSPVNEVVANFAHVVCTEAPPPVLVASPPRRRSRQQPQDFTIRRSERLAKKSRHHATKPVVEVQNVMMRKLGLTSDTHPPDASSFQQFEEAFSSSLTDSHCEALNALLPAGMGSLATGV